MPSIESCIATPPNEFPVSPLTTDGKANRKFKRKVYGIMLLLLIFVSSLYFLSTPDRYFRMPLKTRTEIAGTFGEVRKDHFHLGIDIRTGGRENLPVYAMADGFIYRVSIQGDGYGKALYIAYTNGLMSVYGHLNSFSEEVTQAVYKQQLLSEQWAQEIFFKPDKFPVKKGTLVAYSGNTGSSEGPHLHLEIHNSKTRTNLNPVVAGITIPDNTAPSISSLWLYNGGRSVYDVNGIEIKLNAKGETNEPLVVRDSLIRIGIETDDKNQLSKFRLGIYHAQLFLNDKLHFEFKLDSIPVFKERYVNATIDYGQWFRNNRIIQFLFRLPGNHLPAYKLTKETGMIHLEPDMNYQVKIVVKDANSNTKAVKFSIRYKSSVSRKYTTSELLIPGMPHKVSRPNVVAYFSPLAFYDAVPFSMSDTVSTSGAVSKTVKVNHPSVPVHTKYRVQLKTSLRTGDPSRKNVLMELNNTKERIYVKGDWIGDFMDGSFDRFGSIRLVVDKVPPRIRQTESKKLFEQGDIIRLTCSDNMGPVDHFNARIDGKWVPFEQKKNSFHYVISSSLKKGNHCLEIIAGDLAGNISRKKLEFIVR